MIKIGFKTTFYKGSLKLDINFLLDNLFFSFFKFIFYFFVLLFIYFLSIYLLLLSIIFFYFFFCYYFLFSTQSCHGSTFYLYVMCRCMVSVNRMNIPTVVVGRMQVFFPYQQKVGQVSDFYDFLNLILCLSNLIKMRFQKMFSRTGSQTAYYINICNICNMLIYF